MPMIGPPTRNRCTKGMPSDHFIYIYWEIVCTCQFVFVFFRWFRRLVFAFGPTFVLSMKPNTGISHGTRRSLGSPSGNLLPIGLSTRLVKRVALDFRSSMCHCSAFRESMTLPCNKTKAHSYLSFAWVLFVTIALYTSQVNEYPTWTRKTWSNLPFNLDGSTTSMDQRFLYFLLFWWESLPNDEFLANLIHVGRRLCGVAYSKIRCQSWSRIQCG